ncbi:MAG: hypothetical protein JO022_03200, partial [Acidobacteriaceae bacterium]|nr:hypothetical protein [Acidobacteriaceae bacterium]
MNFTRRFLAVVAIGGLALPTVRAQAPNKRWSVYQKISPCQDTRQDWFTVAQSYPRGLGSPNVWQLVPGQGPFAADTDKMGGGFGKAFTLVFCTGSAAFVPGGTPTTPCPPPANPPPVNPNPPPAPAPPANVPPARAGSVTLQSIETIVDKRKDSGFKVSDGNVTRTDPNFSGQVTWNPPGSMDSSGVLITIRTLAQGSNIKDIRKYVRGFSLRRYAGCDGPTTAGEIAPVYVQGPHGS